MPSDRTDVAFPVHFEADGLEADGCIENLGRGGVFVGSSAIPGQGQSVRLRFVGPRGEPVQASGLVWWTTVEHPSYGGAREGFGVRVVEADRAYRDLAEALLRRW